MKILVVGCNGQLGTELCEQLSSGESELGSIPKLYANAALTKLDVPQIDIADLDGTIQIVEQCSPDLILNCAAYTNVDGCETHADDAYRVNAIGARNLAIAADKSGSKLVHLSTDYVFSGVSDHPYREYDLPEPASVYGKTKLAGEQYVREFCRKWFLIRTAWLYGYTGKNFVQTILKKAGMQADLKVVSDQRGNPTNAADLAYHILKVAATEEYGIYHCTGNGECSWYDFATEIIRLAGLDATVSPCRSDEYPSPTKRPQYSSLDHMALRLTVGDEMRPWQEAIQSYIAHIQK